MQWKLTLPSTDPTPTQNGTATANFELSIVNWVGLSLCDPNSAPGGACTPNSDANGTTAGSAFLELQFFPPGPSGCSDTTKWCVLLHINTAENFNSFQKTNCAEPTTAVFLTTNGSPGGPQLSFNNGDTLIVTLQDTTNGLQATVNDVTTSTSGSMVASGANGFQHNANKTDCTFTPFNFHPEFATASQGLGTPWANLFPNVSFDNEIGHWELCSDKACSTVPQEPNGTGGTYVNDTGCGVIRGVGGCTDTENDHDGTSYLPDWPDGSSNYPTSWIISSVTNDGVGPLSAQPSSPTSYTQGYKNIEFETTETTTVPAGGLYPFFSQAGTGNSCVFNFGNDIPGVTTNDFSKAAQYNPRTVITNPCFPASATILPTISKAFTPSVIPVGTTTTLSFTLGNLNSEALTGVAFTDTLPAGITVSGTPSSTCGGSLTAGGNLISLSAGTISASSTCSISVTVTAVTAGVFTNVTSGVSSNESLTGNGSSAVLSVALPPSIVKTFSPNEIVPGGSTTLMFVITNPNLAIPLHAVGFTDTLPGGLKIATPNGLTNTCSSTPVAVSGTQLISLAGAVLSAPSSCTITVNLTATNQDNTYINTTSNVTSAEGGLGNQASDTIIVAFPPKLSKSFADLAVPLGYGVPVTFTISNPNSVVAFTGLAFTDNLPAGLLVANPNGLTGSCPGGTITATPGSAVITLTGASLAPGASCSFTVTVVANVTGTLTNTTDTATSNQTVAGNSASATLTVGSVFEVNYAANLASGDSSINISNSGENGASLFGPGFGTPAGNLCINVYALDAGEELVSCCSCLVTPNALVSLSVQNDILQNLSTGGTRTSVVIKLVSTLAGGTGTTTSCMNSAALQGTLASGLLAWGTTLHAAPAGGYAATENPFVQSVLSPGELASLTNRCTAIIGNGSGAGICNVCRTGGLGGERMH